MLKRLAVGGMAELYLAQDPAANALRVIKRILPYLAGEPEFVQMFLDEARIAAQLHHPNIIQVYELGKLEDSIFISMEFVDGVDLRRVLVEELKLGRAMPYRFAALVAQKVCEGLHYAHNVVGLDGRPMQIIHRDISPQNVMVGFDGGVKLVDFGIAKAGSAVERSKPGVIKGKFLYLAPEQLSHDPIDHRADLFALGTMLYELTTGKSPFYKPSTEAVILAVRNEDPPPPHLVKPDYPPELSRIVMRCMTKDRNRRYQQGGEIAADLGRFLARYAPTSQTELALYIGDVLGEDGDRTLLDIPERLPPPVATASMRAPRLPVADDQTLSTASGPPPRDFEPSVTASTGVDRPSLRATSDEDESTMDHRTFVTAAARRLTPRRIVIGALAAAVLLVLAAWTARALQGTDVPAPAVPINPQGVDQPSP